MRTRVIPAQITTVEDKIAGNLSLTQILILLSPVFLATIIFALLPPNMLVVWYKIVLIVTVSILCIFLSLRIKGIVVANWLVIVFRYNARPRLYLFNKNDTYLRTLDLPKRELPSIRASSKASQKVPVTHTALQLADVIKLEYALASKKLDVKFRLARKGGIHVAFQEITK